MKADHSIFALLLASTILSSCDSNDTVEDEPFPVGSTFDLESFTTLTGDRSPVGGLPTYFARETPRALHGFSPSPYLT